MSQVTTGSSEEKLCPQRFTKANSKV